MIEEGKKKKREEKIDFKYNTNIDKNERDIS